MHAACGRGWVPLGRRCDMLSTSGFVDDVMLSYHGADGAELSRRYISFRICSQGGGSSWTSVFDRVHQNAEPGAKFAIYDCLVIIL